jgi:hypothetical protein
MWDWQAWITKVEKGTVAVLEEVLKAGEFMIPWESTKVTPELPKR